MASPARTRRLPLPVPYGDMTRLGLELAALMALHRAWMRPQRLDV